MGKTIKRNILFTLLSLIVMTTHAFTIQKLKTEYMTTPLGIDVQQPRFSWQMGDSIQGASQTAYQITVTSEYGHNMWNSGKIPATHSVGIRYQGSALQPMTRYKWTVSVWNGTNEQQQASSWFETGLMSTTDKDTAWGGAQWIGANDENGYIFYSQYLPVFRIDYKVQLDRLTKTTEAGFIYGGNDERLMDRNKNLFGLANEKDQSYVKVVFNIAPLFHGDSAQIDVYRVGYTQRDRADTPFASAKIPTSLINKDNCYHAHNVMIASVSGRTYIWVDQWKYLIVKDLQLNPSDHAAFPVVGDVGFYVPKGKKALFGTANIHNFRQPWHTISILADNLTVNGPTALFTPHENGAPLLRTEFSITGKSIAKARLYATARGAYEMMVNGHRVSDDYLNPGLTQYNKTLFYQTFDVTKILKEGNNALGAILNEGWWSGALTYKPDSWNFFGDRQALLAELVINYTDGTQQRIVTRPSTWRYTTDGPVRMGSLFQGEVYDATRESLTNGWTQAGYNANGWHPAVKVSLDEIMSKAQTNAFPTPDDYSKFTLTAQIGQPVRQFATLTAQSMTEPRQGVYVYDMAQNMAGVPEITFHGLTPGTKVLLRFAEMKYPDLPTYKGNAGMVMTENMRDAMEQDIYIAKGGTETFHPRYTYHGYRYVEVTGIPTPLPVSDVKGIVLSSVDQLASDLSTNDPDVNRLYKNIQWSTLANVFSVPTDCPQRNERMGWSGDLSVFAPSMTYLFNGAEFLRRHLRALRDTQLSNGDFSPIAPIGGNFGGPLWASVGIVVPWQSYQQYGDIDALREHYTAMKQFINLYTTQFIDSRTGAFHDTDPNALGDWLGFEQKKNDNNLLYDAYLVHELDIMQKTATVLGKNDDAQRYAFLKKQRTDFINTHYVNQQTGEMKGNTQTSYALPLAFGIIDPSVRAKTITDFLNLLSHPAKGDDGSVYPPYSLMTGFIGTAWISNALSECGHSDAAYRMLENRQFPSWLYPVKQGATTIWERLNSYTIKNGFGNNNSMNSFNHYAFGSVAAWLMQHSLGIKHDELAPAFKHFYLEPEPDPNGGITEAQGHYDSMYGRINSCWHQQGNHLIYRCTVPANTSATVRLPITLDNKGRVNEKVMVNGKKLKKKCISVVNGKLQMEIPSGDYHFEIGL